MIAILKYWRLIALGAVLVGLGVSHWMAYSKGVQAERSRSVTKVIEIEKEQDHIRNLRPDDVRLLEFLRRGKF